MLNTSLSNFTGLQIKLASPEEILSWSKGEVTKPETINYRTFRPEKDGLFCEKIFGPVKDYECFCGKYKKIRYKGIICDKCGVEVTTSKVRRERMGHIALVAPVAHLWYLKNSPSPMGVILDIPQKDLEAVVYFTKFLVTEVNPDARKEAVQNLTDNSKKRQLEIDEQTKAAIAARKEQIDDEKKSQAKKIKNKEQLLLADKELDNRLKQDIQKMENKSISEKNKIQSLIQFLEETVQSLDVLTVLTDEEMYYLETFKADIFFKAEMGAEAVHKVLGKIDTDATIEKVAKEADKTSSRLKKRKLMYKLRILRGMRESGVNPQWMIMKVVPIIPPDLRPMVQLTGGRFATSDLNDLYRRVINRNNRLKKLIRLGAPDIILRNEKRMLQEVVDMLIDSTKTMKNRRKTLKRTPRSLSDMLKGKKGRFRRNLLGKRVDYSARSAIVVGPELKLNQVGLPKEIAIEIYRPFLLRELMVSGVAPNIKSAKNMIDNKAKEVYDILDHVTKGSYVLLNRAPTLHKLSILAFKPILVDGLAIRLHPSVCEGFNADFDGDQMGVHLPLSAASLKEAKKYMLPSKNLLKASDGTPVALPSKEMAIGIYYMTSIREEDLEKAKSDKLEGVPVLGSKREAILAYQSGKITMRELVVVKIEGKMEKTTYGRILFNSNLPKGLPFQNYALSGGKQTRELTLYIMETLGRKAVVKLVDALKNLGFLGTTLSGLSLSIKDTGMLPDKNLIIKAADLKVAEIQDSFNMGLISSGEKTRLTNQVWMDVTEDIADKTWQTLSIDSPIRLISGAGIKRASKDQIKQLSGMRGLVVDPTGRIVPLPTKSSFRQGLSTFEYVTGARGARKGLADTALKTADAGYLTRKLVDATHSCIIRQEDCGTTKGLIIDRNEKGRERVFGRRIGGRILSADVVDSKGVVIATVGTTVNDDVVKLIEASDAHIIEVRSPLTCQTRYGLCQKCYGWDLSTRKPVEIGVPVGVIAAQSIGEPGTQLTMRTKHTGGVVGVDVTQGLPRVQELFEMRTPKMPSPLAELGGKVKLKETNDGFEVSITGKDEEGKAKTVTYLLPIGATMLVGDGDLIAAGTQLTMGSLDVKQIKEVLGHLAAQRYLINGIQAVYESQGIGIHDKHFEVLVKEMTNKVRISDPGETLFAYGQVVSDSVYATENEKAKLAGKRPAKGVKSLLGLIQSSLTTNSWLSAASFQQTTTTLTEASLVGSIDNLIGLKENVIIGRLIPVGKNQQIL